MKTNCIPKNHSKEEIISATVTVLFFRDKKTNSVIADCPALDICTYGKNLEMAKKYFVEAFSLWKETVLKMGTLKKALQELGWECKANELKMPKETKFHHHDVPVELLSQMNQDFKIMANSF